MKEAKIKNKSLVGADLTDTSFAYANLSGVNLTDVILKGTNFWKADLSGVDFTVTSKAPYHGTVFQEAILPNSNFEGVNLSPAQVFVGDFVNARDKIEGGTYHPLELMLELYGGSGFVEGVGFIGFNFSCSH